MKPIARKRENLMKTRLALMLCLAVPGMAIEGRAEAGTTTACQYVRGGITETVIPSPNDPFGRVLGNVDGVLNGASTAVITSIDPLPSGVLNSTSFDVFVTNRGDMLTATGAVVLTPVPGKPPGEFALNATLTITGGSGGYAGATGTITFEGQGHNVFGGPGVGTFDVIYQGSVCGPNAAANGY
jgi:hypothetical protein